MIDREKLISEIITENDPARAKNLLELLKSLDERDKARRQFWSNPLMLSIAGGLATLATGVVLNFLEQKSNVALERERLSHQMVRDAITSDPDISARNIQFLAEAGLLGDVGETISFAASSLQPRRPGVAEAIAPTPDSSADPTALLVQVSSHTTELAAQNLIRDMLADEEDVFIMLRTGFYAPVIPVGSYVAGSEVIKSLPDELQKGGPFIRRVAEACADLVEIGSEGPATVRECTVADAP